MSSTQFRMYSVRAYKGKKQHPCLVFNGGIYNDEGDALSMLGSTYYSWDSSSYEAGADTTLKIKTIWQSFCVKFRNRDGCSTNWQIGHRFWTTLHFVAVDSWLILVSGFFEGMISFTCSRHLRHFHALAVSRTALQESPPFRYAQQTDSRPLPVTHSFTTDSLIACLSLGSHPRPQHTEQWK